MTQGNWILLGCFAAIVIFVWMVCESCWLRRKEREEPVNDLRTEEPDTQESIHRQAVDCILSNEQTLSRLKNENVFLKPNRPAKPNKRRKAAKAKSKKRAA